MGVLDDLRAADAALADEVHALADEQATFLADVAARLAGNEEDPAAIAQVVADIHDRQGELRALADAQRAADPGPPPPAHADPTSTLDPNQVPPHDGTPEPGPADDGEPATEPTGEPAMEPADVPQDPAAAPVDNSPADGSTADDGSSGSDTPPAGAPAE